MTFIYEMMNGRIIGVVILFLGVLLILTPWYIFPVCKVGRYSPPGGVQIGSSGCHGTLKAETILGGLAVIIGVIAGFRPNRKIVLAASLAAFALAALIILFPAVITGMCKVPTMPCRVGTFPALVIDGILFAAAGLFGVYVFRKMR